VSMLSLGRTVLFMCMGARQVMDDSLLSQERVHLLILASPIGLYGNELGVKQAFYHCLEPSELSEDFRFEL
jgi:hypothetical protein